ncbi:MAG: hypothetical protein K6G61_00080 [Solobacterium sp.]|nr:hypothetical protein [Solobacterium sp.]
MAKEKRRVFFLSAKCALFVLLLYLFPVRRIDTEPMPSMQYGDICVFMRGKAFAYDSVLLSGEGEILTGQQLAERHTEDIRIRAKLVLLLRLRND